MRNILPISLLLLVAGVSKAQVKVFKEISEEVSSEMKVIVQDKTLVGYVVFTQLEKASEDSFNYMITVIDENLNDIGVVKFREESLELEAVSFEQDIICLAYLKSNIIGKEFKDSKAYAQFDAKNLIFLQFLTLAGKIIHTNTDNIFLKSEDYKSGSAKYNHKFIYKGYLPHRVQLKNVSGKGFACFYGDKDGQYINMYDLSGEMLWQRSIGMGAAFGLLTSGDAIYLLEVIVHEYPHYYIIAFNSGDGLERYEISLTDPDWHLLKVHGWEADPVSGIPYAGGIITKEIHKKFIGFFYMDMSGNNRTQIKKTFIYWDSIQGNYIDIEGVFRDFEGNTCFLGQSKASGFLSLLTVSKTGRIAYETVEGIDKERKYYIIENPGTGDNFIITDDAKDILVYSLKKKKILRTIPRKDGNSKITAGPGKEGYIMIIEKNKKEKYTKLSMEALN